MTKKQKFDELVTRLGFIDKAPYNDPDFIGEMVAMIYGDGEDIGSLLPDYPRVVKFYKILDRLYEMMKKNPDNIIDVDFCPPSVGRKTSWLYVVVNEPLYLSQDEDDLLDQLREMVDWVTLHNADDYMDWSDTLSEGFPETRDLEPWDGTGSVQIVLYMNDPWEL